MRARSLGVLFVSLAACRGGDSSAPEHLDGGGGDASAEPVRVELVTVASKQLETTVELEGEVSPYERVALFARANGFVAQVLVDRGSHVKAGQVLATLRAPELGAQRAEADAKLHGDQATYDHLRAAAETPGAIAGHEVEVAEAAVKVDRARSDSLRALEQYLTVTSPFDGVVTERGAHPGALVGPQAGSSTPLMKVEQVHRLRLTVAVPETFVGGIAEGASATFSVRAYPGERHVGIVKRIASSLDTKTRSMPVELDVDNADGRLAPGMFASVTWPVRRPKPSLFVPPSAVAQSTDRTFVVRVKDGLAEPVNVQRGLAMGELVEVFGAIGAGDVLAKRATEELRAGVRVVGK